MDYRFSTTQRLSLTFAAPSVVALALAASVGCQSNAQQDLVARELRMQEDQIYAMEDYLSQYQQLVCKYRSENAALRRRLAEPYYDGEEVPEPRTAPPAQRDGPAMGDPPARPNGLEPPDVPPLEGGASHDPDLEFKPSGIARKKKLSVHTASHEEPPSDGEAAVPGKAQFPGEAASAASSEPIAPPAAHEPSDDAVLTIQSAPAHFNPSPRHVSLRGEVVPNDSGGGPRLVVDVAPIDAAGRAVPFNGELSLMLLALQPDGTEQSLARWDYGRQDAASALDPGAGRHTMRFYLELPPDTPIIDATQIWVRLVPTGGDKLLAHAAIRLGQSGRFASLPEKPIATSIPARIASETIESDWTIARPGEPANLPEQSETASSSWRTATQPIPDVVHVNASPEALSGSVQQAVHTEPAKQTPRHYKPPTWSPERYPMAAQPAAANGGTEQRAVTSRPSWSAAR